MNLEICECCTEFVKVSQREIEEVFVVALDQHNIKRILFGRLPVILAISPYSPDPRTHD
jgi:hypothetical protein